MQQADRPVAIFQAILSMGGISKFDVPVRVTVRDASGREVSGETVVFVIPRLGYGGTAGGSLGPGAMPVPNVAGQRRDRGR
jgi:hypothetical protein